MINYAAKARKAYLINNFDKILNSLNTLHSTVETMTLFVNDQAYNYILKLKEVIKTSPMYKHNIKRLLNDMDKEIKRYNASIYYINKERSEVIADITQAMEDCLMPYIDDLAGAIRAAVWSRGVSEERTEAAVLSLIVSSLATTSGRLISGGYQIMKEMGGGQGGNPFTFMSIDKIRHLSTSLSDAITGGEIALEEKEANDITKAMDVFIEKISDSDIVDKVISILEEAESKKQGGEIVNYLDGYVEEILSEPYYDDYGSGIFRWWVKVSYICEGIGAVTILMFDTREEAEAVKPGYKFLC
jgi:hypothetical protein